MALHMGPMAQDMYAPFGSDESDAGIDTINADGVALAAIRDLNLRLAARNDGMQRIRNEMTELKALMKGLAPVQ